MGRKFWLGIAYLAVCTILDMTATLTGTGDWLGLGSMNTSIALGVGAVVWGNVQEHRAANGNGK